jgi:triosephosphate isomerase
LHRLQEKIMIHRDIEVVLSPSMLALQPLSVQLDRRKFRLAAQNAYFQDEGPYTGEVSFTMLRELVHYCIVGHSERRHIFGEELGMVRDKVAAAVRNDITPILCVGETKHERQQGEMKQVLHDQLMTALSNLTAQEVREIVIAYEPVWSISNGVVDVHNIARPTQVGQAIDYIRNYVSEVFGPKAGKNVRILYGGSVVADVISGFLDLPGIDGFLVGASSLNYHEFAEIISAARRWQRNKGEI